jgi:hypothetical protein
MMELLPPVGCADVATKRDLDQLEERMDRGEIGAGQAEALASRMDKPEQARNVRDNEDALRFDGSPDDAPNSTRSPAPASPPNSLR